MLVVVIIASVVLLVGIARAVRRRRTELAAVPIPRQRTAVDLPERAREIGGKAIRDVGKPKQPL
jgi:hypothetical protein